MQGQPPEQVFFSWQINFKDTDGSQETAGTKSMEENNSGTAPSQVITINGQEYDPNEVSELMEVGRQTREMETKYNTKLDRVWPDYGQKSQRLSQLEKEHEEARKELESFKTKKEQGNETPADIKDAKDAARKLGIVLDEDAEGKFLTEEKLQKLLDERDAKSRNLQSVLKQADDMEKELDGSDGRPKFNRKVVMAYAAQYKMSLDEAYEDMNEDALKSWKAEQLEAQKKKGLKTLTAGGDKAPARPKLNRDNLQAALEEALSEVPEG